jgi:hypothetical protein
MRTPFLKRYFFTCALFLLIHLTLLGQPGTPNQRPSPKIETLKGVVIKVEIYRGMGPGQILIKTTKGDEILVLLGSIRYLMQNGVNLTVSDDVEIRGAESQQASRHEFIAIELKNNTTKKNLRLRDDNLQPLWRRGGNAGRQEETKSPSESANP